MNQRIPLAVGLLALLLGFLSLYDLSVVRPWDGITPVPTTNGVQIQQVAPDSPAARGGIQAGNRLLGVSNQLITTPFHVPPLLKQGSKREISYLVQGPAGVRIIPVKLIFRRGMQPFHILSGILLTVFFLLGLIVFLNNPMTSESRIFYYLTTVMLLVFTCRMRPFGYAFSNLLIRMAGQLAFVLMPALFLHFFLIYPVRHLWIRRFRMLPVLIYLVPLALFLLDGASIYLNGETLSGRWIGWLNLVYGCVTLLVLFQSRRRLAKGEGTGLLRVYGIGMLPFVAVAVPFGFQHHQLDVAAFFSTPLMLIPAYLSYRIFRFGFFNIRILLKKSLLYSFIVILLSVVYAILIFFVNTAMTRLSVTDPYLVSMGFAVLIVFLFNPLHAFLRSQLEDMFLQRERARKQQITTQAEQMLNVPQRTELESRVIHLLDQVIPESYALLHSTEHGNFRELPSGRIFQMRAGIPHARFFMLESAIDSPLYEFYQRGFRLAFPFRRGDHVRAILFTRTVLFEEELEAVHSVLLHFTTSFENSRLLDRLSHQMELERDLKIAGFIQQSLIPSDHPENHTLEAFGLSLPSRVVGGDFFDYIRFPERRIGVLIGDVAGKSVPAAMMMVAAKEIINSQVVQHEEPQVALSHASEQIHRRSSRNMFVAACYGVFQEQTRQLVLVNAGMPAPILVRDDAIRRLPLQQPRFPLGILPDVRYSRMELALAPNDLVLLVTDGVSEPLEADLDALILQCNRSSARRFVADLMQHLKVRSGTTLGDDATILALRIKPESGK